MVENSKRSGHEKSGGDAIALALAAITDVDLKRTLLALWESEKNYREMVEHANSIIMRIDSRGTILFFNEFAQGFFGYSREEVVGRNVLDTIVPSTDSSGSDMQAMIVNLGREPERYRRNENENIRRDGSRVCISWANTPFYDEQSGDLVDILCVGQDITEQNALQRELREKSGDLERYFDLSLDLLCIANIKGEFIKVNPQWERVLGYTSEELVGRQFLEFVHPDDLASTLVEIARLDAAHDVENFQNRYRCKDGGYRWIEWRSAPYGELIYAVARDITDRKLAEEVLRQSEETFRNIVQASPLGIHMYRLDSDDQLIFLGANPAADRMLGSNNTAYVGMSLEEAFPLLRETEIPLRYRRAARHGERWQTEQIVYNDSKIAGAFEVYAFQMSEGKVAVLFNEITSRKQVEESLRESEIRFKALHNASFGGIFLHDQGVIFECNQGLAEMTGYSTEELNGMDGLLLVTPASSSLVMEKIQTGNQKPYEAMGVRKNGEEYPVRIEARIIPYKGRQVRSVEFRDLSEVKRNEAEREKLQSQLVQAQKMESVGRLAGGIAHDFNNMLGVILGNVELATHRVSSDHPLTVHLREIGKAAKRSADLTRQLLAFARKQTVTPQILDLNETVGGMLNMLRRLIGEDIDLRWLPGKDCGKVNIDPSQVDQILANLCINARDAIGEHGRITIETDKAVLGEAYCATHAGFIPGTFTLLMVSDNGCGMDANTQAHLFEPFFTTKEIGKGTGLGLAMIYGIVKQNRGFINVYSEPGQGTTFRIYLPRHDAKAPAEKPLAPAPLNESGHETILLVEDEPMILSITNTMLSEFGYSVLAAATPGEAIALAREHGGEIHLLITDVVMPEMNGRDLAMTMLSLYPKIKRLFMSGYTANVIAHHGVLDAGVHFLQKPFSMDDLGAKVREVLGRG